MGSDSITALLLYHVNPRQTSLHCLVEANVSMGIRHFPNLERFLTSWKQQNKQHLICKLPALDSVPRGGGKLRR